LGDHAAVSGDRVAHCGQEPSDGVELLVGEARHHLIPPAAQGTEELQRQRHPGFGVAKVNLAPVGVVAVPAHMAVPFEPVDNRGGGPPDMRAQRSLSCIGDCPAVTATGPSRTESFVRVSPPRDKPCPHADPRPRRQTVDKTRPHMHGRVEGARVKRVTAEGALGDGPELDELADFGSSVIPGRRTPRSERPLRC